MLRIIHQPSETICNRRLVTFVLSSITIWIIILFVLLLLYANVRSTYLFSSLDSLVRIWLPLYIYFVHIWILFIVYCMHSHSLFVSRLRSQLVQLTTHFFGLGKRDVFRVSFPIRCWFSLPIHIPLFLTYVCLHVCCPFSSIFFSSIFFFIHILLHPYFASFIFCYIPIFLHPFSLIH